MIHVRDENVDTRITIHFPGHHRGEGVNALAQSLGLEERTRTKGTRAGRFDALCDKAPQVFRVTDIDSARVLVYPHGYVDGPETAAVAEDARRRGLPLLFFRQTDDPRPTHAPYGIVYRDSLFASRRGPRERAMPAFIDDPFFERRDDPRPYGPEPTVGFCGFVGVPAMFPIYHAFGRGEKAIGLQLRRRLLRVLERAPGIRTQFIRRHQFWAGVAGIQRRRAQIILAKCLGRSTNNLHPKRDYELEKRVYAEFVNNLLTSDYTLAVRGAGNFSYRFYETLAAGRVPLFVNTDCALPLDDKIDWRRHVAWVEERELKQAPQRLLEFHKRHTPESWQELQRGNRELWEKYLAPSSFFETVVRDALEKGTP